MASNMDTSENQTGQTESDTLKPTYSSVVKETNDLYYNEEHKDNQGPIERPTYSSMLTGKNETYLDNTPNPHAHVKADVLLEIPNAKVFFISGKGEVSTPSNPSVLRVCRFVEQATPASEEVPQHFVQVGTWTYPLVEGVSPSLQKTDYTYIFPDVTSSEEGAAVGLVMSEETPPEAVKGFEHLIETFSAAKQTPADEKLQESEHKEPNPQEEPTPSESVQPPVKKSRGDDDNKEGEKEEEATTLTGKIGHGLSIVAEWVQWGIDVGSEKVTDAITQGGETARHYLGEGKDHHVPSIPAKGTLMARNASSRMVQVSSYVVKTLGDATLAVSRRVAQTIRGAGNRMVPERVKRLAEGGGGQSRVGEALNVAGDSVKTFAEVFLNLENAAKALGKALAKESTITVSHRFGSQVGELTENAMYVVGNSILTAHNVVSIGPRAIAMSAAKNTAKSLFVKKDEEDQAKRGKKKEETVETIETTDEPAKQ